ncbi:MAG: leucine-rich repeat domain-containing protein [Clostridiales bacterium]|jgi:hypothetical protein|nr:leucine-rich repeat domain-containing protein [Clostridiales bacterium]
MDLTNKNGFLLAEDDGLYGFEKQDPSFKAKVVYMPEGVKKVGIRAFQNFDCEKLVMPSTLKTINAGAFLGAKIDVIDFADCKLEYIGFRAFDECHARTKLPETVEEISDMGAY